ncbi:MAG: bifunctional hydroxymethylpyrimidine kinase/phosphomethylpyrimidine kinase [Desulfovibrio sp.]|uniref:bifunctional hydroxymethylpyrimidine kinase/phosphomethylpyrimidine kinase n=1 Tax=Desulfovibrio sp. 7SRBS1 TaxID=3378064 RepID=UPI003B3D01CD
MKSLPAVLTIAGSDSGGGAGIQADLKTFSMLGTYGASVITALTAQNSCGVTGISAPEPDFAAQQLRTVLEDIPIRAAKTGMLFSEDIIQALADVLEEPRFDFPLVVDPVCVATSGDVLLKPDALGALKERMIPLAAVLTPNRQEAELLTGRKIDRRSDCFDAISRLLDMGAGAVLLKGGHFDDSPAMTDWLGMPGHDPLPMIQPRVDTNNTHGTGCTLSSAIAAHLALGCDMMEAVRKAQEYLNLALRTSFAVGKGHGPANHMAPLLVHQGVDRAFVRLVETAHELCSLPGAARLAGLGMNLAVSLPGGCRPEHVASMSAPMVGSMDGRLLSAGCPCLGGDDDLAKGLLAVREIFSDIDWAVAAHCTGEHADGLDLEGLLTVEVGDVLGGKGHEKEDQWISSSLTMNWELYKAVADAGLECAPQVVRMRGGAGSPDTLFCFAPTAEELVRVCSQISSL